LRTARELLGARGDPLSKIVGILDEDDQEALDGLLVKLLTRLYGEVGNAQLLCRLCDRDGCVPGGAVCPVGQAERDEQDGQDQGKQDQDKPVQGKQGEVRAG
ncbi:MAG TPA: hypothetical protein VGO89_09735, partial [Streptomyces sp.]|nr:hypothetical protein [Streptomyces sp.]